MDAHYAFSRGWSASLGIYNILNTHAAAAEFWYVDRLKTEVAAYRTARRCSRTSSRTHHGPVHDLKNFWHVTAA